MRKTRIAETTAIFAVVAAFLPAAPACGGHGTPDSMLVSSSWLSAHLKDPNLVILSVGEKTDYDQGHIPGAVFLDYMSTHTMDGPPSLTMELLPISELVETFGKLGVSSSSRIVLYMSHDRWPVATRVFWTLDAMGLGSKASILDGGFPMWKAEGGAISKEVRTPARGTLDACPQTDVIAETGYVSANLKHPGVAIVDARVRDYFTGARTGNGKRPGHIPGATNVPFDSLVDDKGKLKSGEVLRSIMQGAGVKPGDRIVSYCHIGQQATLVYFVARYLGYDARMYDGSWEDWSAHKDLPAETGSNK
jgi:thiosulfate/3-mercaptopyruvate sulfurtransferase